jgi:hypothetical protein
VPRQFEIVPDTPKFLAITDEDVGASVGLVEHDFLPDGRGSVKLLPSAKPQGNDSLGLRQHLPQMLWLTKPPVEIVYGLEVDAAILGMQRAFFVHEQHRLANRYGLFSGRMFSFLDAREMFVAAQIEVDAVDGVVQSLELLPPFRGGQFENLLLLGQYALELGFEHLHLLLGLKGGSLGLGNLVALRGCD